METEEVIEVESLENRNGQFPIYKTKTGRRFLGTHKDLKNDSVIGFSIPDACRIECSEKLLEETGEFGDRSWEPVLKNKFLYRVILREDDLEKIYI